MGKVKIKRKSTLIDMTAMSDVTVLLLTFFMLTSTFLAKEPTTVVTPSSVSEEKVPMENLVTILISGEDEKAGPEAEGKVFISFTGSADSTLIPTERLRLLMLEKAEEIYKEKRGKDLNLTPAEKAVFMQLNMFGVPFENLKALLNPAISQSERDKLQTEIASNTVGIPYDKGNPARNKERFGTLNDLQIWFEAISRVSDSSHKDLLDKFSGDESKTAALNDLKGALRTGKAIAVKADKNTPVSIVEDVFDNLQTMNLNKFTLMTALKSEDEPTQ
ncbi:MAG TPA: biopolymer transporter ExbD [Muribaculaceae bacterium]|jgi:biopolymer transport protein ExbD|nr:biopolymer transporter ExbD [Muribaculaceae bacterium]